MAKQLSGQRYAQAIFDLAQENNQVEAWGDDLAVVAEVFQDADFAALMKHADMPAGDKLAATATVLAGIDPLVRNLVDLLVSKNSVDSIVSVYSAYTELLDRHLGRQRVDHHCGATGTR